MLKNHDLLRNAASKLIYHDKAFNAQKSKKAVCLMSPVIKHKYSTLA